MLKAVINCHSLPAKENDPLVLVKSAFSFFALRIYDNQTSFSWQKESLNICYTTIKGLFFFNFQQWEEHKDVPRTDTSDTFQYQNPKNTKQLGFVFCYWNRSEHMYQRRHSIPTSTGKKNLWAFGFTVTPASSLHLVSFFFFVTATTETFISRLQNRTSETKWCHGSSIHLLYSKIHTNSCEMNYVT